MNRYSKLYRPALTAVLLLTIALLPSCRKGIKFLAAAAAEEVVIEGGKAVIARHNWKPGIEHPANSNLVTSKTFDYWEPKPGITWADTNTSEPRTGF